MSGVDALRNLGARAARRLTTAHKPLVRLARRRARAREHRELRREAAQVDREIAQVAADGGPIIVGPWLAEVGYEVLYWIPFLRWFQDAHGIAPQRLIVVSRGGMDVLYRELAAEYVDIFDLISPEAWAARNAARRGQHEGGGQKQSGTSAFDEELLAATKARAGIRDASILHPSLLFRLFRQVWYGNLPLDLFWQRTRYATTRVAARPFPDLPADFIAAKLYTGPALSSAGETRDAVRALVASAAARTPVVLLETALDLDEHRDFELHDIPGVISAAPMMTASRNLAVQIELIARSRFFLGSCGGLAWLAPFLGVPTVAVYDNDDLLSSHLHLARQAGRRAGAAEFAPLDLRALGRIESAGLPRPD